MTRPHRLHNRHLLLSFLLLIALFISACNLSSAPEEQLDLTDVPTITAQPSRTPFDGTAPTLPPVTTNPLPTAIPGLPTRVVVLPPTIPARPTSTPLPVSIVVFSPVSGNVVAGNVQVLGAATHPQFLQYQLEYGPEPNHGNLWYPATGIVQNPVANGILGIWNTRATQDGLYQLRLRVTLRDGTSLSTVANNIRIQNTLPTPIPTATTVDRPIAAFTQDRTTGQTPLVVRFTNQSSGHITSYSWNFGDGSTSPDANPIHTFRNPGVYNVRLTVNGPGGSSNVARQINVQSAAAPIAGFTQDKTSGPSPLTVQFTDTSTGSVTQRHWNFGDTQTSTETNPSHTFNEVGTYNVILTVTGPGGSSFVTRQITVENPTIPEPIAAIVPSTTEGDAPLTVQFDASDSSGQIDNYNWNFGDGILGNGEIITHTYNTPGTYEAQLIVVGPGGQSERRVSITVNEVINAPNAIFDADPVSGNTPLTVNFNASASEGTIESYTWDFGDGTSDTGSTVVHQYTEAGTYTVVLTVAGPGGQDTATLDISASEPPVAPSAAFESLPQTGIAPLTVQFSNQTQGQEVTFAWDFGDGNTSEESDPLHIYENPGEYTVTLNVTSASGNDSATDTITVIAPNEPPVVSFQAAPETGEAPLTVQFVNSTQGENITYTWDFGDGNTSTEPSPAHTYNNPGTYTVTLTAVNPGGSSADTLSIIVNEPVIIPAPIAEISVNPNTGEAPLTVTFNAAQSEYNSAYSWNFGDGVGVADGPDTSYTFNTAGTYNVTLTVTGPGGENQTQTVIEVTEAAPLPLPVAEISANPTTGEAPLTVTFNATQSENNSAYNWNFGDGVGVADGPDTSYTFNTAGTYSVTLTVTGPGGETQTQTVIEVTEAAPLPLPVAEISANPTTGEAPLTVTFNATQSEHNSAYSWNFGDGVGVADGPDTSYTFNAAGTYSVTLTVTGPGGENQTQTVIEVTEAAPLPLPVAEISANPTTGEAPLTVTFNATQSEHNSAYSWNFGDGVGVADGPDTSYTFNTAGTYSVTLTVTGPGGENQTQTVIEVTEAAPLPLPVAEISANPMTGEAPLTVTYNATQSEYNSTYSWNFGDGVGVADGPDTSYTFNTAGTYSVTLSVTGPGGENQTQTVIEVTEAVVETPAISEIVLNTPVLPNLNAQVLRPIFDNGVAQGRRASVFAVVGDDMATQPGYLDPFADPNLVHNAPDLQAVIEWYRQTDLGDGRNSFNRESLATGGNWLAQDLLDSSRSNPNVCNPGENPVSCEIRLTNASVVIISVGLADARAGTDNATFRNNLQQVIQTALNSGVIPVVTTVQPQPDNVAAVDAINVAIIETANGLSVPVYNLWAAYNALPNSGLSGDNFTPSTAGHGAGALDDDALNNGTNRRNHNVLSLLNSLHNQIFPEATP